MSTATQARAAANSTEPFRVLLVEDDLDARENLVDILELDGIEVDTAGSIAEALKPRNWAAIGAVMLDRKLPDGDASLLFPQIKSHAPEAAIIVVTGFADLDGAIAALQQGATDYLIKPINPDAIRASLHRVIERRRVAAALHATEERLRVALENSSIGCFSQDTQLRYTWAYKPFAGLSPETLLGKTDCEVFKPGECPPLDQFKRRVLSSGQRQRQEFQLTVADQPRWYEIAAEPQYDESGSISGITSVTIDITDSKRAQERLLQQERLAAIGETMAGLVHEGRNALQRSKACLEMLAVEVHDRPDALDLLARLQRAQDDLHQLYEEVRQYAAPLVLDREPTCVASIWRETWSNLSHVWEPRGVRLVEQCHDSRLLCEVDRFALGQVFRNIFENAIQVSPPDAAITIVAHSFSSPRGEQIRIRIRDQGPGIPHDQRASVFEAFFTTKAKGTGLGLAISQRIVRAHEGSIEVTDGDSPGAEFVVTLPKGNAHG